MTTSPQHAAQGLDAAAARYAFEEALRTSKPEFEQFFLSRFYGLEYAYEAETLTITFPIHDFLFNPQGWVHGGVSAFVLDVAMGHLLWHTLKLPGSTLEMKTQYLAPLKGKRARCVANFMRRGNSICFLEARIYDDAGTVTVAATSTWRVSRPKAK